MTWKEFKDEVEKRGVADEREIWYIDVTFPEPNYLNVETDHQAGFVIFS